MSESQRRQVEVSRRRALLSAISFFPVSRLLCGQQSDKAPTFSTGINVVNVLTTVRDKQGKIVRNLTKDDFTLQEDDRPQTIRYFAQQSDLPLTLGLLVDTSGSERRMLGTERQASYTFLEQVLRPDKDKAFLIHFDHDVELLQDLTSSRERLEKALALLETPNPGQSGGGNSGGGNGGGSGGGGRRGGSRGGHGHGGTAFYGAVYLAGNELMTNQTGRKAVVMLTDGEDNASKISLTEAITSARRADTLGYSIRIYDQERNTTGFPGSGRRGGWGGGGGPYGRGQGMQHTDGKKVLEQISKETGGTYFEVSKRKSLEDIYSQMEDELRNQYSLGYTSDKPEGQAEFRKIELTVKQKGLTVQTRNGYYARA